MVSVSVSLLLLPLLLLLLTFSSPVVSLADKERISLREEVREMFTFAFTSYMNHSFPLDELRPITCGGMNTWAQGALTLVDSLDALLVFGLEADFADAVKWIEKNMVFNRDVTVSVFETNIRVLGGLLSAHLLAPGRVENYSGSLLTLARELADRLLPAFDTPTGIPFGMINLRRGVLPDESRVTSVAGAGTFAVEFGLLSRLTGDKRYEVAAKRAAEAVFSRRSSIGLLGNHINIMTGAWTHTDAGVGAGVDSIYEYMIKGYVLLGDRDYLRMFRALYRSISTHSRVGAWFMDVTMDGGKLVYPIFNALMAFFPGMEVFGGASIAEARKTHSNFVSVWRQLGVTPEGYNILQSAVQAGQKGYPLRPELAESTFFLYQATRDPSLLAFGRDMVSSLQTITRTNCGFASVKDVTDHDQLEDRQESFFLAETLKYLFLLFDEDNPLYNSEPFLFNTEGHLIPIRAIFRNSSASSTGLHASDAWDGDGRSALHLESASKDNVDDSDDDDDDDDDDDASDDPDSKDLQTCSLPTHSEFYSVMELDFSAQALASTSLQAQKTSGSPPRPDEWIAWEF
jgi:mannosidase alpha-like ER degradation enhancer 2